MTNLTISEKRTIFHILILIMQADCIINSAESSFLDDIFKLFDLDISEFDHIEDLDIDILANEFSNFSKETKDYAKDLFVTMSKCDGFMDPREIDIINRM